MSACAFGKDDLSRKLRSAGSAIGLTALLLAGCATQPSYQRPEIPMPSGWSNGLPTTSPAAGRELGREAWWEPLHDPAIGTLIQAALADNPTLGQAAARVDEARASARVSEGQRLPQLSVSGSATRARVQGAQSSGSGLTATTVQNSANIGPGLSWELDLWGRLKETARAANLQLDARTADAAETRLSLTSQIADAVLRLRACDFSLAVRDRDIASRNFELARARERLAQGNVAPVDVASAESNLASARTARISQQETCARTVNELVALSGRDAAFVRSLVVAADAASSGPSAVPYGKAGSAPMADIDAEAVIAAPPPAAPAVPATVLLGHPAVIAAEREAAARWSEIGVARADRLPRIELVGLLTGNWIRMLGSTSSYATWSAGAELSAPLFDGGAGAANVRGVQARYHQAVEALREAIRTATRDVEDALAGQQSAQQRVTTSREAVEAARAALRANEARWRAGAISMFELEDARRQFNAAQESAIAAARDRAQSWVALVLAAGGTLSVPATVHPTPQGQAQQ